MQQMVRLSAVLSRVERPIKVTPTGTYAPLGVKWYAAGVFTKDAVTGNDIKATRLFTVADGDFIYNRLFGWKGAFALADSSHDGCVVSGEFPTFRADETRLLPRYLLWYFSAPSVWTAIGRISTGTSQTSRLRFKEQDLLGMKIALPPLAEQHRIVRILDEADELRKLRVKADERTRAFIPAVFHEMFGGSRQHSQNLGHVAEVVSGVAKGRHFNGQPTVFAPYLRVANVQAGYLDLSEIKTIEALPSEIQHYELKRGDVVMTEGGDEDKLGRGAMLEEDLPGCIHQNHVFRVRVDQAKLLPVCFANYLQTPQAVSYFLACAKRTTNLASINMTQLRALPVPLPDISLQREFAARVEQVRAMQEKQAESRKKLDELSESLLYRAFSGGL